MICVKEMIIKKFGEGKWKEILKNAEIEKEPLLLHVTDVDDSIFMEIVNSIMNVLKISFEQVCEEFAEYWINVYAPRFYKSYFDRAKNAKEFLLLMDYAHSSTTKDLPGAHPPRFSYEWKNDKTIIMGYQSKRNLIDLMVALIKSVGKFYNEPLKVTKLGNDKEEIVFP